jgi:signal transduction histidine kinase
LSQENETPSKSAPAKRKTASFGFFNRRNATIIILLILVATTLSFASYVYATQVAANVSNLSVDEIHSNSQIEANDLGHLLASNLEIISSNLDLIANSHSVVTGNISSAVPLFNAAQNSTSSLTYAYFWMNSTGFLILSANGTGKIFSPANATNLSNREFFTSPKNNETTYFSSATPSVANTSIEYVFVSRGVYAPVSNSSQHAPYVFSGVVAAAIQLTTLGSSLISDLSPNFKSSVGLLDFKGGILYSSTPSLIGQNVFGSVFQNELPASLKPEFDAFLNQSLKGQAGFGDISYQGASGTLAYQPIFVNATTISGSEVPFQFGVIYVTATDTLASSAAALIGQERFVSLITILGIAAVSGGLAVTTLRWNKRLNDAVTEKTSDLVRANEELAAKAMAERDLMNITAHELRTPTQSILANSEILRSVIPNAVGVRRKPGLSEQGSGQNQLLADDVNPAEIVELVESSYRNSLRLQRLTQNILEAARIDNKTFQLENEAFDINELIRECIADIQKKTLNLRADYETEPSAEQQPRRLEPEISFMPKQKELLVHGDQTKTGEVITNILENSIRFSKDGGGITIISNQNEQNYATVSVTDEGSGIDPEITPRLFSKFATKTGTGLGLYISKSYIDAQGGTIKAEDNSSGRGATFSFTLPLANRTASTKNPEVVSV